MKQGVLFISTIFFLSVLLGCNLITRKVEYKGGNYTIEDSEFGVAFIDKFNSIEYYINDTIYKCGDNYYCLISGSQDKGKRWVLIQGDKALDIDSTKSNFTSLCKKTPKRDLLN